MWSLEHTCTWALRIQVYICQTYQSPQHSSKIVKVFGHINVQLYNDLSLQANKHISFKCVHMCVDIIWVNINACEHAIIKACELQSKWTCELLIVKASTHVSTGSTKHVNIQANEHLSIQVHIYLILERKKDTYILLSNQLRI